MSNAFERLFNPRGVAIIGASSDLGRISGQPLPALIKFGYRGALFPVNPSRKVIAGTKCYSSIADIDGDCDLAVIALSADKVPDAVAQCGRRGISFAVVLGGGFRETGADGEKLEREMLNAARAGGVRIIGPNCTGLLNVHTGTIAAFGTLTRPPVLRPGGVSAVVQSSGFGLSLVVRCALAGVGFRYVVTSGNEADINASELINSYVDDVDTQVILAYLEGVSDGREFMAAARRAFAAKKPLIVFKSGNTEQGKRAAASHTANLTGSYDVYKAAFRQCGVIEARDVDQAADFALCLTSGRLPKGHNVALMGGSGGSAAVFSDAASDVNLTLAPLSEATKEILKGSFPSMGSFQNPVDYTAGYPRPDGGPEYMRAVKAVIEDPGIHQLALMLTTRERKRMQHAAELITEATASSDKPVMVFMAMSEEIVPEAMSLFREARIPVLSSPKRIATAMAMLAEHTRLISEEPTPATEVGPHGIEGPVLPAQSGPLSEHETKHMLRAAGIPTTRDILLPIDDLQRSQADLTFPVVAKIVSRDIAHKTDVGGVRLNLSDREHLLIAAKEIVANVRRALPAARLDGILVSQMLSDGLEVIVGVVNDDGFGPVVLLGLGGILAEVLKDTAYRIAPFGLSTAYAVIGELKGSALFSGVRGQPPRDIDALARVLVRVSELAWLWRDRLIELEINPLLVRCSGAGAVAIDGLMTLR